MSSESEQSEIGSISQDSSGHKWGYEWKPEDLAQHIVVAQIEAINNNPLLNAQQKNNLIMHLTGIGHDKMTAAVQSFFVKN